ncbi:MAG: transketolase [Gammaproteobacteria bacterium]|nr:transketolase [Gammaproteobacteria bacterium]
MMTTAPTVAEIADIARRARIQILKAVAHAKGGHVGGPYSAVDMLAALYFRVLDVRPDEPDWPDRDRFVLSKGHSSIALYTVLAMRGYFDIEELATFDAIDSRLQGHPDMTITPGIDMSSGSLGLGFAGALGIALGARALGKDFTTYVMLGDGECNEGIVWEGAHVANRYHLDNVVAIVDQNNLQQFGWRGDTATERLTPYVGDELAGRWRAFGWHVLEVDGHDIGAFLNTVEKAQAVSESPVVIVAHTIKGKGVSFMEDNYRWHSRVPTEEEFATAMQELGETKAGER